MTVVVDFSELRQKVIDRMSTVADDAVQAMILDMNENGPRSEDGSPHMVDLVTVSDFTDDAPTISRHVVSPAEYSSFVDEGTDPHEIRGNPYLAFFWPKTGKFEVFRSVEHPGTPRTGWWTDTLARWGEFVAAALG